MKKQEIVWATNNITGVLCPVPQEMYEVQGYMWTRAAAPVSKVKEAPVFPIDPVVAKEPENQGIGYSAAKEVKEVEAKEPEEVKEIHQTAAGEPFKTEQSAKSAMTKKSLSEDEWTTLEVPDGFIITRK